MKKLSNGRYLMAQAAGCSLELDITGVFYIMDYLEDDVRTFTSFNEALCFFVMRVECVGQKPFDE